MELRVRSGKDAGRGIELGGRPVLLGSADECDLVVDAPGVAPRHAHLKPLQDGRFELHDLGSEAGTRVDGHPVRVRVLEGGERLALGEAVIEVRGLAAPATARGFRLRFPRHRRGRLALAAAAGLVVAGGALASGGLLDGGGSAPPSFEAAPVAGLPGIESLSDLAGGVADSAIPRLQARSPMETIIQDDAAFLHGTDESVGADMRRTKALGFDRVRLTAGWSVLAPDTTAASKPAEIRDTDRGETHPFDAADPDTYPRPNWRNLDRAVTAARDAGLEVMIDVAFWAPRWATTGDPNPPEQGRATWNIDAGEYAAFTKAVVTRYSGGFAPRRDDASPPPSGNPDRNLLDELFGPSPSSAGECQDGAGDEPRGPLSDITGEGGADDGQQESGCAQAETPVAQPDPLPKVTWWTIWNEPNHKGFIQPQWVKQGRGFRPNAPHAYRRLVEAAYPAIKGIQPESKVLVGGTSSTGPRKLRSVTDGTPPLAFVRELACVDRKLRPVSSGPCADYRPLQGDGYSHHPYSLLHTPDYSDARNPDNIPIGNLDRLTRTLDRLVAIRRISPAIRDVYLTEFGYESNPPDPIKPFSPREQALFLSWSEYLAWKNPSVRAFPQFLLTDLGTVSAADAARGKREYGDWQSGLFFNDGNAKPAAASFPLALHADCTTSLTRRGGKVVVIWGVIRPGSGPRQVTLEIAAPRPRPAASSATLSRGRVRAASVTPFSTDAGGYFLRYAPHQPGARYRFSYREADGTEHASVAVPPDSCNDRTKQKKLVRAGANEF